MLLTKAVRKLGRRRLKQIEHFRQHPIEVQEAQLKALLRHAARTLYGQKYGFEDIESCKMFQDRVPINDYDSLKPWIERMITGESNLLWAGTVKWFAQSSGTTNDKSKFIPVSKEGLHGCHFQGGRDVSQLYLANNCSANLLSGKSLTLGGSCKLAPSAKDFPTFSGDVSAIMLSNVPWYVDLVRAPKRSIALLSEWEEKLDRITNTCIKTNITSLSGVPSWFLVLIKHVLQTTGASNLLEIWPNLEVFFHGGINFQPYKQQYKELIPSEQMHYIESYNASEGFFAIQDDLSQSGMLLMLDYGVFYEFIPMSHFDAESPPVLTLAEVEAGVNYAMLITTNSGLWRYLIGDTVSFVSTKPYRLVITGRTKHYINAFGEELMGSNAEKALVFACQETHASITEYTAAPIYMSQSEKGRHEWLIEFDKSPSDFELFMHLLDQRLQEVNSDYEAKRYKDITLAPPKGVELPQGTFMHWLKLRGKLGGQNKIPRLSNDRKYVDQILALVNTEA